RGVARLVRMSITVRFVRRFLEKQPIGDAIFHFVSVAQDVALIEADHILKSAHAVDDAVGGVRLDGVLHGAAEEGPIKDAAQRWWANLEDGFEGSAVESLVERNVRHHN